MNKLETLHVRPLSAEERSRTWGTIASRIPMTPTLSPFIFPLRTVASFAAIFLAIVGTIGVSDDARPGQALFQVDTTIERIESSVDPSSRADHARERLAEFNQAVETQPPQVAAPAVRMGKIAAPEADTMMFSAVSDTATATPLPDATEEAIATTRAELEQILNDAMLDADTETVVKIMETIDEFETNVRLMREQ